HRDIPDITRVLETPIRHDLDLRSGFPLCATGS
ncbi:MAG: hypothetical protein ACI9MR_003683, partial [Myxococcota bacterium]